MEGDVTVRLEGKRAVIVGCAANIGLATVDKFLAEGARVHLVDVNPAVRDLAAERGEAASASVVDAGTPEGAETAVAEAVAALGGVDVLVCNAGIQRSGLVQDLAVKDWEDTLRINAGSVFYFARQVLPHMIEQGSGAIVNTSSVAGTVGGPPSLSAYSASKGAIVTFSKVMAREVGPQGIRVNTVCPGWIDTAFNDPVIDYLGGRAEVDKSVEAGVALRRQGRPDEVANVISFLASDESSFITGHALVVDGGA
jgi:NAD(P)-dependent dehydrogenase (short-subunit alcohol dehydrogenase family)